MPLKKPDGFSRRRQIIRDVLDGDWRRLLPCSTHPGLQLVFGQLRIANGLRKGAWLAPGFQASHETHLFSSLCPFNRDASRLESRGQGAYCQFH